MQLLLVPSYSNLSPYYQTSNDLLSTMDMFGSKTTPQKSCNEPCTLPANTLQLIQITSFTAMKNPTKKNTCFIEPVPLPTAFRQSFSLLKTTLTIPRNSTMHRGNQPVSSPHNHPQQELTCRCPLQTCRTSAASVLAVIVL